MSSMFLSAVAFSCDISKWDVSSVINMDYMFRETVSFDRKLCETFWFHSKASKIGMFGDSPGSIPRTECASVPYANMHRPVTKRELVARTSITTPVSMPGIGSTSANKMACPKCGVFKKSGRVSCCAPGGAWFDRCGGAGNSNVDHKWSEGVEACERKFKLMPC